MSTIFGSIISGFLQRFKSRVSQQRAFRFSGQHFAVHPVGVMHSKVRFRAWPTRLSKARSRCTTSGLPNCFTTFSLATLAFAGSTCLVCKGVATSFCQPQRDRTTPSTCEMCRRQGVPSVLDQATARQHVLYVSQVFQGLLMVKPMHADRSASLLDAAGLGIIAKGLSAKVAQASRLPGKASMKGLWKRP